MSTKRNTTSNSSSPNGVNCEQLRELIPAYSIGATDPQETAFVESMLEYCPDAAAELTDYLVLADEFLYIVPPTRDTNTPIDVPMPKLTPVKPVHAPAKITKLPSDVRVRSDNQRLWIMAAAAAITLVLFGGINFYWFDQVTQLQGDQQALATQLATAQVAMLPVNAGEVHHRDLLPNQEVNVNSGAHATMIWNSAREVGSLYVTGLPPLTADKTYQLWIVRDGESVSLGVFRVDDSGTGTLVFESPEPIEDFQHIGVSEEPNTGSPMPTTPHLIIGNI
ncbi:MAG: anti-sigma factor [Chitinophagaceae bacterium]|nr:anti-sigma factor [Anaerolineae bacterium]